MFIGDLPKGLGLVELYETIKGLVGGADFELVMKKPTGKYFYYAFCRFNDIFGGKILNVLLTFSSKTYQRYQIPSDLR